MILDFAWNFKPDRAFTDFEIHPCREEDGHVNQCDNGETPHFWSVYVRYDPFNPGDHPMRPTGFGGLDCICDCDTEEQAKIVVEFLINLIKSYNDKDEVKKD